MISRTCLIIDNEDQSDEIEKLVRDAQNIGINLECQQFNVGNTGYSDVLTNGLIDISKVVIEFRSKFKNQYFDIVAFDWDLEDENITGVELIRKFTENNLAKFSPKVVYSGVLDDVIKKIILENLEIKKIAGENKAIVKDGAVTKIKSLVKNRALDYLDRGQRDPIILKFLKEDIQSTELIVIQTLNKYPDFVFGNRFVNEKFKGKTFQEIASYLETDDFQGNEFKRELIEQVIAYLTEIV